MLVIRNMYGGIEVYEEEDLIETYCHHLLNATRGGCNQSAFDQCVEYADKAKGIIHPEQRLLFWAKWRQSLEDLDIIDPLFDARNACLEVAAEIALSGVIYKRTPIKYHTPSSLGRVAPHVA